MTRGICRWIGTDSIVAGDGGGKKLLCHTSLLVIWVENGTLILIWLESQLKDRDIRLRAESQLQNKDIIVRRSNPAKLLAGETSEERTQRLCPSDGIHTMQRQLQGNNMQNSEC